MNRATGDVAVSAAAATVTRAAPLPNTAMMSNTPTVMPS